MVTVFFNQIEAAQKKIKQRPDKSNNETFISDANIDQNFNDYFANIGNLL